MYFSSKYLFSRLITSHPGSLALILGYIVLVEVKNATLKVQA